MAKVRIDSGAVFERYEKKYQLQSRQLPELLSKLAAHMAQDEYGLHTICTTYFDTDDYAVIRRCLEKPSFKEKLRLRSYGTPAQNSTVYLEMKKKLAGITYKRRVPLKLSDAKIYFSTGRMPDEYGQIFQEIDWYTRQQPLKPKVLISYDRIALYGLQDSSFRITLDQNIRWRDHHLSLEMGDYGQPLLPPGTCLMEVKTLHALPVWFASILSEMNLYPNSFSKYGSIYQQHLSTKEDIRYAV